MENKKQSSIEWLVKELNDNIDFIPMSKWDKIRDIVQQAKLMHKEEIIEAFDEGQEYEYQYHINSTPKFYSDTYYKETFGGQDNE